MLSDPFVLRAHNRSEWILGVDVAVRVVIDQGAFGVRIVGQSEIVADFMSKVPPLPRTLC